MHITCYTLIPTLFPSQAMEQKTHNISVALYSSVNLTAPDNGENFHWYEWTTNATSWHCDINLHLCYITSTSDLIYPINCRNMYLQINCSKTQLHIKNITTQTPLYYTLNKAGINLEIAQRHNFSLKVIHPTTISPSLQSLTKRTFHATGTAHAEARRQSESTNNVVTPVMVVFGGAALVGIGYLYGRKPKIPLLNAF